MTERIGTDIEGSGSKGASVDIATGALTAGRYRLPTPHPATPDAVADTVGTVSPEEQAPYQKSADEVLTGLVSILDVG
jgi:polyphosphate glucokinase